MLKLKYLFENFELAKDCLRLYDADEKRLDKLLNYYRISSNAVYPFRSMSTGRLCFLRLSPVEEKDGQDVLWELRLIQWLVGQGFPAMKPYPMRDGRLFTVTDTVWGRYNVSCFEAVDGDTLEDCDGSLELIKGYGRTLGRLHALLKVCPYKEGRRDHAALMEEARERFKAYRAPEKLMREWEAVESELKKLPADKESYGIVHYDFEADNVLYCDETDTYGVIDFDDAILCWYALDVVRAIDCLGDVAEDIDAESAKAAFLSGYREETAFTDEQMNSLPLMRRLVRVQAYGTLLHVLSEPADTEPDWMTEIIQNLERTLSDIENTL